MINYSEILASPETFPIYYCTEVGGLDAGWKELLYIEGARLYVS